MVNLASLTHHFEVPTNRLYLLRDRLLQEKKVIIDLVSGNVNTQGITFPPHILKRALTRAVPRTKVYRPDPLGQKEARQAISRTYAQDGWRVPPEQILLTPGTSISYWYAMKILANPGDEILAPSPTYPLFESIAQMAGVKLVSYRLREKKRWEIDFDDMESIITPRTRAIILISPHNPTGAVTTTAEVQQLAELASRKNLAIISDEVFSPFLFGPGPLPRPAQTHAPLVITLNGFSKMLALPGSKIGWMAVSGTLETVQRTMRALDMISDTFLPVNEFAQNAVSTLLSNSRSFQKKYQTAIRERMALAGKLLKGKPFIAPEGGFYLAIDLGKNGVEEEVACDLLEKHRILTHPGYFYDMEGQHLILSFVSRPPVLRRALEAVMAEIR
jgi:alanine-synthesizing transaminase